MRILHFADLHLDPSTSENSSHAAAQILELARSERPDLIVNAGDLSMKRGYLAPWVAEALREWHCQLAEVAPVVVVAGNHDLTYDWERAGTLRGALAASREDGRIYLAERPCVFVPGTPAGPIEVACLPYPSKYALQATNGHVAASEINARLSAGLAEVARSLAVEAEQIRFTNDPKILVYHGSIRGAKTGTEQTMGTEIDPVLEEPEIPRAFQAVLCGHIHKPQVIGRAVYAGSPCPLNFGEENHEHGVQMWEFHNGEWFTHFHALEPKHRLLTIDLREVDSAELGAAVGLLSWVNGARLRLLLRLPRGGQVEPIAERLEALAKERGAFECRLQVERDAEDRSVEVGEVRAEAALDSLLDAYVQRNPELAPVLHELKTIGAEIDGALPPEVKALERFADYRLIALRWSNWKSFGEEPGEIEVSELGRLVCIEGENASGKSNLMEIEAFALWGRLPRGKLAIGELVRHGAREAWVEVEIKAGGRFWKARRSITVNTKGDGKGTLTLSKPPFHLDDGPRPANWAPANAGDSRETQAKIEQLVGPFDLYLATRFASQGDIARLLNMTGAELKDTIQGALGTGIFEHRGAAAKERGAEHQRKGQLLASQASVLVDQAGNSETWQATLAEHEAALAAATMHKADASRGITAATEALDVARRNLATAEERALRRQEKEKQLAEARASVQRAEARRPDLQAAIESGNKSAGDLAEHQARAEQLGALAGEEQAHLARSARLRDLEAQIDQRARKELADQGRRARERDAIARERTQLEEQIGRDEKTASMIGRTPFGEACAEKKCELLRLPIDARDSLELHRRKLGETDDRIEALKRAHAAEFDAYAGEIELLKVDRELVAAEIQASREAAERIGRLRAQVMGFQQASVLAKRDAGVRARATLEEIEATLPLIREQAKTLEAELAAMEASGPGLLALKTAEQEALGKLKAFEGHQHFATERENHARQAIAGVKARMEAAQEAIDKAAALREESDLEVHCSEIANVFARAMGRDGVPYLMLERALPALEAHANHFLGTDDLRLEIEPARDLRSGEQRSEVVVRFRDRMGLHHLGAASGYQQVALGYALRAALAQVQAEAHGLRVSHWIADEGWGAFDEERILDGQQMLRRLAERFERVFFISHVGPVREVADTRLRVVPDAKTGSRLEIVGELVGAA